MKTKEKSMKPMEKSRKPSRNGWTPSTKSIQNDGTNKSMKTCEIAENRGNRWKP